MTAYFIVNASASALTDVNAGGSDVPAYSQLDAVTLTSTELLALLTTAGVAVTKTTPTAAQKRQIAKVTKLACNPGGVVY